MKLGRSSPLGTESWDFVFVARSRTLRNRRNRTSLFFFYEFRVSTLEISMTNERCTRTHYTCTLYIVVVYEYYRTSKHSLSLVRQEQKTRWRRRSRFCSRHRQRAVGARRSNRSRVGRTTPETHAPDSAAVAVSSSGRRSHKILIAFVDTLFSLLARRQQQWRRLLRQR